MVQGWWHLPVPPISSWFIDLRDPVSQYAHIPAELKAGGLFALDAKLFTTSVVHNILNPVPSKKEKPPLSVTHPELAKEADGWDPAKVTKGSREKLKWVCSRNHFWEAIVRRRTGGSGKCPQCSKLPAIGIDDLATKYPEIAKEAFGWNPQEVKPFSALKRQWRCSEGHIWICAPAKRIADGTNCTFCSGRKLFEGVNDLKSTHPDIAKMASGWDPTKVKAGSNIFKDWQGSCGHLWNSRIADVAAGSGCPICTGQQVLVGFNDLQTTHPDLSKEAVGWNPKSKTRGSNSRVLWECQLGHQWKSTIKSRSLMNSGCPTCHGKITLFGFNDLESKNPKIASQAYGWDPKRVTAASSKRLNWQCELGHIWRESVAARTVGGRDRKGFGCPFCSGKRVLEGLNDVGSRFPEIAVEAEGWDPSAYTSGSRRRMLWKCKLGHTWSATISDRAGAHKSGCPYCTNQKVLAGFNDIATTHPDLAMQILVSDPKTLIAGTNRKVKWQCPEGHQWVATVHSRSSFSEARGCPTCSKSGFDPNSDGYLYYLEHRNWKMFQIGITNIPKKRIATHQSNGWEALEIRGPMDGHLTQQWETAILRMLKAKGADLSNSKIAGKFDGYSEAWSKSTFEVKSIKDLMRLTEEFEG